MEDYKKRFIQEYNELSDRTYKLGNMLANWEALSFEPNCSYEILYKQYQIMCDYKSILEERAIIEKTPL